MVSQEIISVNIIQIIISLLNLVILYLIIRRFLFKPVQKVLAQRQQTIDSQYAQAEKAVSEAEEDKKVWNAKMQHVEADAEAVMQSANKAAKRNSEEILQDARTEAGAIISMAKEQAALERRKAEDGIKEELADVSTELAGKLLGREINEKDHRDLIDAFIDELGDKQ